MVFLTGLPLHCCCRYRAVLSPLSCRQIALRTHLEMARQKSQIGVTVDHSSLAQLPFRRSRKAFASCFSVAIYHQCCSRQPPHESTSSVAACSWVDGRSFTLWHSSLGHTSCHCCSSSPVTCFHTTCLLGRLIMYSELCSIPQSRWSDTHSAAA